MDKQAIDRYFAQQRENLLADIARLVRIASDRQTETPEEPYGPGAARVLAEALAMARSLGFAVRNYDNRVGTADLNDKPPQLDILAHLDVVPGGDGWTMTGPFEPRVAGGRIYGRGTADDKGPAVAALYAMRAIRDLGIALRYNVRLILGTDEECGSSDIDYYYAREPEAPVTISPDAEFPVINIEKGRLRGEMTAAWPQETCLPRIVSLRGGIKFNVVPDSAEAVVEGFETDELKIFMIQAEARTGTRFSLAEKVGAQIVRATGRGAHAAAPESGINAITGLLDLLAALPLPDSRRARLVRELNRLLPHGDFSGRGLGVAMSDELSGPLTLSFNLIGTGENVLTGVFDCRAPLCANDGNVRYVAAAQLAAAGIILADLPMSPPHHVSADLPFVKTLLKCYEQYSGKAGKCIAIGGSTYVHGLARGVAFGCGDPEVDNHLHGADEFADIEQLLLSAKIFTQVIIDLCS